MKKYQLKYNNGEKYLIFVDSDKMSDIFNYIGLNTTIHSRKLLSLWMDGKELK